MLIMDSPFSGYSFLIESGTSLKAEECKNWQPSPTTLIMLQHRLAFGDIHLASKRYRLGKSMCSVADFIFNTDTNTNPDIDTDFNINPFNNSDVITNPYIDTDINTDTSITTDPGIALILNKDQS